MKFLNLINKVELSDGSLKKRPCGCNLWYCVATLLGCQLPTTSTSCPAVHLERVSWGLHHTFWCASCTEFLGHPFSCGLHLIREPHTTCVKGIMALQWLYSCVVVGVYAKGREHVHYKVCVMLRYYPCCYYTVCALISMQLLKCSLVPLNWLWLAVNIVGSCVCMYTCSWPVVEFLQSKVT